MKTENMIQNMNEWYDDLLGGPLFYQLLTILIVTVSIAFISHFIINKLAQKLLNKPKHFWETSFFIALHTPLVMLIVFLGVLFSADVFRFHFEKLSFLALADPLRNLAIIFFVAWFGWRFTKALQARYLYKTGVTTDKTTVLAIGKLAKTMIIIISGIMILQTFNVQVTGILMFGGVGTAALAFSAKDLLANFFGGLIIYMDKPFAVGDWIRSPDRNIEGVVEDMGWRLTKIRTFDKRPLYVPNSVFNNISIENPSRMSNRRLQHKIGVRYQDADKIKKILTDIEQMLATHPDIDNRQLTIVKLVEFAPSSLTFMVYAFTKTTDWAKFQAVQQDVLLKIIDIVLANQAEFAFPSTTLYIPDKMKVTANTTDN